MPGYILQQYPELKERYAVCVLKVLPAFKIDLNKLLNTSDPVGDVIITDIGNIAGVPSAGWTQ